MPNKTTASDKTLKGNPGRRTIKDEVEIDYMEPKCPDWLTEDARKIWDRKAPALIKIRVLSALNEDEFGEYCNLVVELRRINKFIQEENASMVQITEWTDHKTGETKQKIEESPYSKMRRLYQSQLDKFAKMFKLRPHDMAGLYTFKGEDEKPGHLMT